MVDARYAAREATMTAASLRSGAPFLNLGDVWRRDVRLEGLWFNKLFIVNYTSFFICVNSDSTFHLDSCPDICAGNRVVEVSDQVVEGEFIVTAVCQDACQVA